MTSAPEAASFDIALELERGDMLSSPLLSGFSLPVGQLFDEA